MESLNGHERVLHGSLHGNPELALLLAKLEGHPSQALWEFLQDLQRNMPVGGPNLWLADSFIMENKSKNRWGGNKERKKGKAGI